MATQSVTQFSPSAINTWSVNHAITDGIVVRNGDQILWRPTIGTNGDLLREAATASGSGSATVSGCTITGAPNYEDDVVKTVTITATEGQSWSASVAITHNTTSSSNYPTGDISLIYLAAAANNSTLQTSYPNAYSALGGNNPATGLPWLDATGNGTVTSSDASQFLQYPLGLHSSANTTRIEAAFAQLQANINSVEASINGVSKLYPTVVKTFTISGTVAGVQEFGIQVLDGSSPQKTIIDSTANPKLFQELARNVTIRLWPEDRCLDGTSYNQLGFINEIVVDLPGVTSQTDLDNNYLIERVDFGTVGDVGSVQQRDWTHNFEYHSAGKIKFTWGRGDGGVDTSVEPDQLCYSLRANLSMAPSLVYYPQDHDCACTTLDDIINAFNFYAINKTLALSSAAIDSHGIEVKNANGKTMFNSNQPSQVAVFRGTVSGAEEPFNYPFEETVGDDWQVVNTGKYLASGWTNGHVMIIPPHVEGEQHDLTLSTGTKTVEEVDLTNLHSVFGQANVSTYDDLIDYYANFYTNTAGLTGWGNVTGKYLVALKREDSNGTAYKSGVWDGYQYTNQTVNGNKLFLTFLGPKRFHNSLTNTGNNFLTFYESNWASSEDYYDVYECNEDVSNIRSNGASVTLYPVQRKQYFTDFYVRPQSDSFTGDWYITTREYFRSLNDGNTGWVNADLPKYRPRAVHVFDGNTQTNTNRNTFDVIMTVNSKSFGDINTTGGTGIVNAPSGGYGIDAQTSAVLSHTGNHPAQQMTAFTTKTRTPQFENVFTEDLRGNKIATTSSNKVVGTSSVKRFLNSRPVSLRDVEFSPKRNRQLSWQWNSNNDIRIKFGLKNQAYTYETNSWLGPALCQIVNFGDGM